jgi:hypothetical protein
MTYHSLNFLLCGFNSKHFQSGHDLRFVHGTTTIRIKAFENMMSKLARHSTTYTHHLH